MSIKGRRREVERVKTGCEGSPRLSSGLMIYRKDSQDPEKLLILMIYYSKRIQVKVSKGKRHIGRFWKRPGKELPIVFSQWNHIDSTQFF